ncbi:hypothetical protein AVEN_159711-2-1, partial [Araneus ventricosus]
SASGVVQNPRVMDKNEPIARQIEIKESRLWRILVATPDPESKDAKLPDPSKRKGTWNERTSMNIGEKWWKEIPTREARDLSQCYRVTTSSMLQGMCLSCRTSRRLGEVHYSST